jgi:IPT/TIG domain
MPGSSRKATFFIQMLYLIGLGIFVILYRGQWIVDPGRSFFGPLPFLVPWFGAVGAVVLSLSGVFEHRSDWDEDYCFWYWSRPFIGAVTSTVSVLIFQSGILAAGGQLPSHAHTPTAKNLLYYIFAFIAGYRENVFRELIRRVADVLLTPGQQASPPVIGSVTPPQAVNGVPTTVTVGGSGFTGTTAVKLGSQSIPFITDSDTQLTVTIPAMPQGPQTLLVTNGSTSASVPFEII